MKTTKIRTLEGAKMVNPIHVTVNVDMDVLKYDAEIIGIGFMNLAGRVWRATKKAAKFVWKAAKYVTKETIKNVQYDLQFYPALFTSLVDVCRNSLWPAIKLNLALLWFNLSILFSSIPLPSINLGEHINETKDQILLLVDKTMKYKRELDSDNSDMQQLLITMNGAA